MGHGNIDLDKDRLREHREDSFLTMQGLADKCGLNIATVCNAENGRAVSITTAEKLCEALGCNLSDIRQVQT